MCAGVVGCTGQPQAAHQASRTAPVLAQVGHLGPAVMVIWGCFINPMAAVCSGA